VRLLDSQGEEEFFSLKKILLHLGNPFAAAWILAQNVIFSAAICFV